jgi:hypothetical protein
VITGECYGSAYSILAGKPEGRRPLRRNRRKWEDNTKINLLELGLERMEWIHLAEDRENWWAVLKAVMNLRIP